MEEKAIAYQQQMQNQYKSEQQLRREATSSDAAANFKQRHWPADPFDGMLIDAEFLEVSELVGIFKAARVLKEKKIEGLDPLILYRENKTPLMRVNHLWLDSLRQRKAKICEYIEKCCFDFESVEEAVWYAQEIEDVNDPPLKEYFRQAQEVLALTIKTEVANGN